MRGVGSLSFLLSVWFGLGSTAAGQAADVYAKEPLVIERFATVYAEHADGTGTKVTMVAVRVQADSALKQVAVLSTMFAGNSEKVEWEYARLKHRDGSVTETPVGSAMEVAEPVTREAPFYSDLKSSQLPLKDLRVGDRLEWQVKVTKTKAEAANEFWGQQTFVNDGVVLDERMELRVPAEMYVNVWSPKHTAAVTTEGAEKVYRWGNSRTESTVGPEAEARATAEKKRVRTEEEQREAREGKLPDVAWTTFRSWAEVGEWYRGLSGARAVPDAAIQAKAAELTEGKATEREKVQAVYAYVATQIHYIGVAFGVGRYQPHSADDVLNNQYGDCKDKHTLLASMLLALGLKPDAVLIGAGVRFNEAVPSPAAFNHLITRVSVDGKPVWLDTTAELAPFGMLVYATRGHEALVIPRAGEAMVARTPKELPFAARATLEATGALDAEGTSNSRLTLTFRGDDELMVRAVVRQLSPAQYEQFAQQLCANIGYAGTASRVEFSRVDDTAEPFTMSFDYRRSKAGDWANYKTVPQLLPIPLPRIDDKDPPVQALELGVPRVEVSKAAMTLPVGWKAEMPEAIHAKSEWATDDLTYRVEKGVMYTERRVEVLKERVPVGELKTYDKFAEKAGDEQFVQLKPAAGSVKADSDGGSGGALKAGRGDVTPQELIEQAYQDVQRGDARGAMPLLDRAKAMNAEEPRLWGCYGDVALRRGEMTEAEADYQKELKLHPASVQVYPVLVQTQMLMKHKDDALESLRRWQEAAPGAAGPRAGIVTMLFEDGKYEEAAKQAEEGLAQTRQDEAKDTLRLMLGRSEMKLGRKEQAEVGLRAAVANANSPGVINNLCFELVNAGMELPLCETKMRGALNTMEEQSRNWTLDESLMVLRAETTLLQAAWDTMGWTYFKEGKAEMAEAYVKASWLGRQSEEVGKHLAEIETARGEKAQAAATYRLAVASAPTVDPMGVRLAPTAAQKEMLVKAAGLTRSAAGASGETALQSLRKLPLGKAAASGVAEYKVLVGPLGLMKEEPTGAATVVDAAVVLVRMKTAAFFPAGEQGQLMYRVMLNCHGGECEAVLEP